MDHQDFKRLINSKIDKLKDLSEVARRLKERFTKTENHEWRSVDFLSELVYQTTHLLNSINRLLYDNSLLPSFPTPGIDKGLRDELSDVLFNLFNFANAENITIQDALSIAIGSDTTGLLTSTDYYFHASNLVIQAGELWDAVFRRDGYKHMARSESENNGYITLLFGCILAELLLIADIAEIDIVDAFDEMLADSTKSLDVMLDEGEES